MSDPTLPTPSTPASTVNPSLGNPPASTLPPLEPSPSPTNSLPQPGDLPPITTTPLEPETTGPLPNVPKPTSPPSNTPPPPPQKSTSKFKIPKQGIVLGAISFFLIGGLMAGMLLVKYNQDTRRSAYGTGTKNIGEECADTSECISGMLCYHCTFGLNNGKSVCGYTQTDTGAEIACGTGTEIPPGGVCVPGAVDCSLCPNQNLKGQVCQANGQWSGICVNADACGYVAQAGSACSSDGDIRCSGSGCNAGWHLKCEGSPLTWTCELNAGTQCENFDGGADAFVGCGDVALGGDGNRCNNCYDSNNDQRADYCRFETSSCGAQTGCTSNPTPTPTNTSNPTPTPTNTSNPTPTPTNTTNPTPTPTPTPTPAPTPTPGTFNCQSLSSTNDAPSIGDTVEYTCQAGGDAASLVTHYEFQYQIDDGDWHGLSVTNNHANLIVSQPGTYQVQCRACDNNSCTQWDTL